MPFIFIVLFSLLIPSEYTFAGEPSKSPSAKRSRLLDFDDQLIEGLNKKPLDSLQQITDGRGGRRKTHLYRKRAAFRMENEETLKEMRMSQ